MYIETCIDILYSILGREIVAYVHGATEKRMENTQNTIPAIRQVGGELQATAPKKTKVAEAIQPVATTSAQPVATTTRTKDPKRVAAGKRLAEHNRRKREGLLEENSLSSQLSSIPNLVSVGTLLLAAYTVYSNRKPAQQQDTNSKTAKTQKDESSQYMYNVFEAHKTLFPFRSLQVWKYRPTFCLFSSFCNENNPLRSILVYFGEIGVEVFPFLLQSLSFPSPIAFRIVSRAKLSLDGKTSFSLCLYYYIFVVDYQY